MFQAKSNLSELVRKAQNGDVVIITSGREKVPVARIEAIEPTPKKRLGVRANPGFQLTRAFFEPLSDEELTFWNGESE